MVVKMSAVCCMVLHHNTYRVPQQYKRYICEPSYSLQLLIFLNIFISHILVWSVQYTTKNFSGH